MKEQTLKEIPFLCCPVCKGHMEMNGDAFLCNHCAMSFAIKRGIPDFRVLRPSSKSLFQDNSRAEIIQEKYSNCSYEELIRSQHSADTPQDLKRNFTEYALTGVERGKGRFKILGKFLDMAHRKMHTTGYALELGCGSCGPLAGWLAQCSHVIGVDISMKQLAIGKKLLEESKINNVTLICCCAEHLPFDSGVFNFVNAQALIEHVESPKGFLSEAYRVLSPEGILYFDSINRFMVFGPDPHVTVWGVGFLPRRFQNSFVKLIRGIEYEGKRPVSLFELSRILSETGISKERYFLYPWGIDTFREGYTIKGKIARKLPLFAALFNGPLRLFSSMYEIIAWKSE